MQTHSQRLETWLGSEVVSNLSASMANWYGPPIAVAGVPGSVYACGGGGFSGPIKAGAEVSGTELVQEKLKRAARARSLSRGIRHRQAGMAGFASYADLIAKERQGKELTIHFDKFGPTSLINRTATLWRRSNHAGSDAAAAPGGTIPNKTDGGAVAGNSLFNVAPETRHFVGAEVVSDGVSTSLLLYDRLFAVTKTMNSTTTEAVTGVPTRYQSTTVTDPDWAGGNFLSVEVGTTALAATAHNWTVCTYTDQDGNTGVTLPSLAGLASGSVTHTLDQPAVQWFAPLADGDSGIQALTQMQCDAAVATGVVDFVIGHPIAFLPQPTFYMLCVTDGIQTAFNLARVFDDAALTFLEINKLSATGRIYSGTLKFVHG